MGGFGILDRPLFKLNETRVTIETLTLVKLIKGHFINVDYDRRISFDVWQPCMGCWFLEQPDQPQKHVWRKGNWGLAGEQENPESMIRS
ncbi:predicted protein [Coccidioides posadasii str. Silveira]|uniref:Predicted protein n=1 Tax=Coccidioides posadasii (strain RMSCC 757 / Silveira) TaxID=443226 RepID=E9D7A1_COCPS|nr:predicted protein [Coccidioides posadasii str. Silveira]